MSLTVKVNGSSNGLVHKGSNHLAKNTVPDVCKTPSPAGPVPIPYPVIISKSSDLANGTTTVKADGEMVAVKDCEYSMCTGDEPGTAGGVVSSTFKKEAKFILFSFDVKMDGKNACRLGDKMTMNHQNTVCMAGTFPTACGANPFVIDCQGFSSPERPNGFTDCEKKQICKKAEEVNNQAQSPPGLQRRSGQAMTNARAAGDSAAAASRRGLEAAAKAFGKDWVHIMDTEAMFYDDCARKEWRNGGRDPGMRTPMFDPDHIHEIQLGGAPANPSNFKWMSAKANRWVGTTLKGYDPATHTGCQANCC